MKTGYEDWDQNLKTLSQSLFPDPSKVAQGYYYGSEARKAQLESNKIINQQNWQNRFMQGQNWGPAVPQPAAPTWQQPENVPNAAPIVAPPANLPMSSAVVPGATGVTGPSGGQIIQPQMTPAQAVAGTPAAMAPYMQGTPAPVGPPSAVSPPAPQNTTSNGQQPQNDPVSGVFHPASVNSTGGGVQMAGPANADGSPAQMPFDLQKYVAIATAAGMDAQQAALQGQAYATQAMLQGVLPKPLVNQVLAGTGQAAPLVADIGAAATVKGHEIAAGATIGAANIAQRGETYRKGMELQAIVTDPITGATIMRPLSTLQGVGGTPSFSPDAVKAGTTPIQVQPLGPGTAVYSMPTGRAQQPVPGAPGQPAQPGTPTYDPAVENTRQTQLGAVHNWIDPKNPTVLIPGTVEEARQNGWWAVPTDPNQWNALAAYASANVPPDQAQRIRENVLQFATTTTPKPVTAEETNREQVLLDNQLANHLPVPTGVVMEPWRTNLNPAGASPALGGVLSDLTDQYFRYDPETRGNQVTSANKAIKQLIEEGRINPNQDRGKGLVTDETTINKTVLTKNGPTQVPHFRVDLIDPATKKPYPEDAPIPRVLMRRMATTVAPGPTGPAPRGPAPAVTGRQPGAPAAAAPAAPAGMPPGALAPAPGVPDGTQGTLSDGRRSVVRGGFAYPAP